MKTKDKKNTLLCSTRIIFRMWNYCKQYRVRFYTGFIIGCFAPLFFAFMDSYIIKVFTRVCIDKSIDQLFSALIRVGVMELIGFVIFPLAFGTIYTTYSKISGVIKKDMFRKVQRLDMNKINQTDSGDFMNHLTSDFDSAIQLVAYPGVGQYNPFAIVLMVIAIGVIVIVANPLLGVISLLFSVLGLVVINCCVKPLQKKEHHVKEVTGEAAQGIINSLSGAMVSRMYGLNKLLKKQYEDKTAQIFDWNLSLIRRKSVLFMLTDLQGFFSFAGVGAIGLYLASKGLVEIPTVIFISTIQMQLGEQIGELSRKYADLQKYIVGAERLFSFMDEKEENERTDLVSADQTLSTVVDISHLDFQYEDGKQLFRDFNLKIRKGEKLAVVGGSGGGKTTLYKLLLEFIKKSDGNIYLFGHCMEEYSLHTVRAFFSYVPQDCYHNP